MAEQTPAAQFPHNLDALTDKLFILVADEDLTDDKLREASEGLLPLLLTALRVAGHGTRFEEDPSI